MPLGAGGFEFPTVPRASLVQALRWVAYDRRPLLDEHERIEGYPDPIAMEAVGTDPQYCETIWVMDVVNEAAGGWRALLRALACGAIDAHAYHWSVGPEFDDAGAPIVCEVGYPVERQHRSESFVAVPASAWTVDGVHWGDGTTLSKDAPAVKGPILEGRWGDYYTNIWIATSDLMRVFPPPGGQDVQALVQPTDKAPAALEATTAEPDAPKRGRPGVTREEWAEAVAVLALAGEISIEPVRGEAKAENARIAEAVAAATGKAVTDETARKVLGEFRAKARERQASRGK